MPKKKEIVGTETESDGVRINAANHKKTIIKKHSTLVFPLLGIPREFPMMV